MTNEPDLDKSYGNQCAEASTSLDELWLKHMPWPTSAEIINPNKNNKKPPVPYAIICEQWKNIHEEKEIKRKENEEAINKRREIRMQKLKLAQKKKKKTQHQMKRKKLIVILR